MLLLRVPLPARRRRADDGDRSRRRRSADRGCQGQRPTTRRQVQDPFPARRQPRPDQEGAVPAEGRRVPARGARRAIQHNKFMVLPTGTKQDARRGVDRLDQHLGRRHLRPDQRRPLGPRRRSAVSSSAYWELLQADPGGTRRRRPGDGHAAQNKAFRAAVEKLADAARRWPTDPAGHHRRSSVHAAARRCSICTPRSSTRPPTASCITLAFGINKTVQGPPARQQGRRPYRLLPAREGQTSPDPKAKAIRSSRLDARNNVYAGVRLVHRRAAPSMGEGDQHAHPAAQFPCELHPFQVPARRSARHATPSSSPARPTSATPRPTRTTRTCW